MEQNVAKKLPLAKRPLLVIRLPLVTQSLIAAKKVLNVARKVLNVVRQPLLRRHARDAEILTNLAASQVSLAPAVMHRMVNVATKENNNPCF